MKNGKNYVMKTFKLKYPIILVGDNEDEVYILPSGKYVIIFHINEAETWMIPFLDEIRLYKFTSNEYGLEEISKFYIVPPEFVKRIIMFAIGENIHMLLPRVTDDSIIFPGINFSGTGTVMYWDSE